MLRLSESTLHFIASTTRGSALNLIDDGAIQSVMRPTGSLRAVSSVVPSSGVKKGILPAATSPGERSFSDCPGPERSTTRVSEGFFQPALNKSQVHGISRSAATLLRLIDRVCRLVNYRRQAKCCDGQSDGKTSALRHEVIFFPIRR